MYTLSRLSRYSQNHTNYIWVNNLNTYAVWFLIEAAARTHAWTWLPRLLLSKRIQIKLFIATVESVLLCGAETWTITQTMKKQLDGCYTRMLRMALNVSWKQHIPNIQLFNSIQFNSIQFNSIQFNSIQFNSIQFNSIQFNSIQFNSIQFNSIQFNSIQFNMIYTNNIQ